MSPKMHTHHRSRTAVKKHLFEPALVKKGSNETDSSGFSSTHSLSSATDSDLELQLPTTTPRSGKPKAPSWHPPSSKLSPYGGHIDTLTASLQEINGKLWQVLDRLNDQTEFSHLQQLARHGIPPSAAPAPRYPPTGHSHFVADQRKLPLHSSDRYAGWTSCHDCVFISSPFPHNLAQYLCYHAPLVRTGVCQTHTTAHSCMDILSPCAGHSETWAWCGVPHWVTLLKTARTSHSYPCS